VLCKRKCKAGHAKYWDSLAVDIVYVQEIDSTETRCHNKVVVRGMHCIGKHDTSTFNVANFASTHFQGKVGAFACKNAAKQGADFSLTTA
jgi:hypothetical protein